MLTFRSLTLTVLLTVLASSAMGQTTGAPFTDALSTSLASSVHAMHGTIRANLADAANVMPVADYAFRPTMEIRTFAALLGHVANANFFFCSQAAAEQLPATADYEQETDKTTLVDALEASLAYCDTIYTATSDANVDDVVRLPGGGESRRGGVLMFNTAHNNEHYGNVVIYLRLRGLVPPSTANAQ